MILLPIHFLAVAVAIFSIGSVGVLLRRDSVGVFISIELMLAGAALAFITFSRMFNDFRGQIFALVLLAVAATEAAVGLAIMIMYNKKKKNIIVKEMNTLKG